MRGEKGGCTMKQGKLIRRAVSAALAGCMMFTFSAPALAESTDALMQLSMTRRSAVSVLDAENGDTANYGFTIDLNGTTKTVNESNCKDIFEDEKLSYDPTTNKLTNKGTISGELTIDAPNVDVELTGNSFVIYGSNSNLNIKNARNVTLSTNSFSVVGGLYSGNVEINCLGKLTIKNSDPSWSAIQDNLTVHNALEILVEGRFSTVVGGDVKIECACPATFKNNQNGGIAKSITYDGDYVYYTSDATDAEAVDPNVTSIPAETLAGGEHRLLNEFLPQEEVLRRMVVSDFQVPWNKLYRRKLLENLRYPENKSFEDTCLMPVIYARTASACGVWDFLYNYRIVTGSAMHRKTTLKTLDWVEAWYRLFDVLYQNGIRDALCAAYRPILTAVWDIWLHLTPEERKSPRMKEAFAYERTARHRLMQARGVTLKNLWAAVVCAASACSYLDLCRKRAERRQKTT